MNDETRRVVVALPLPELPLGDVGSPLETGHASWRILAPWTDPLADRGAYRVEAAKCRIEAPDGPAIQFLDQNKGARALVAGEAVWRDYEVLCRVQPLQVGVRGCYDGNFITAAHAGLVFRVETSRKYYCFCIEDRDRLVLYRRTEDDWHILDWRRCAVPNRPVTLRAEVAGEAIRVACPDLNVEMTAVDHAIPAGRAGFRSLGESRLYELAVRMSPAEEARNAECVAAAQAEVERLGVDVPDAVAAGTIDLSGRRRVLACANFATPERCDLLIAGPDGLVARTWDGDELWRAPHRPAMFELGQQRTDGSRRLYLMVGERARVERYAVTGLPARDVVGDEVAVLDGRDGSEVLRLRLPDDPPRPGTLLKFDFSFEVGFGGEPGRPDFLLRQWRGGLGGGGIDVWAYDAAGALLWQRQVETPYGHHNAVHFGDVNGDGKPEVLAGGACFSADGDLLWVHDEVDEMRRISGAGHYDACLVPPAENVHDTGPTVFLCGGSAGVYVVDGRTGRTHAVHRVGHAQWGLWCDVRADRPGRECLVGTRWSNYGILSLFDARGERLWTRQPDYVLQGSCNVRWRANGPEHIWISTSAGAMGLYDGEGRLVKPLTALRERFAGRTRFEVQGLALRRSPDGPDWLGLVDGETVHLFRPEG